MNGYSIENLQRDDRAEISKDVLFSYEFHRMAESVTIFLLRFLLIE